MPRFAANLSTMFTEQPLADRFAAAAAAGFSAVELLFPYDSQPETLAALLRNNGLELALFNLHPGDFAGGERGTACLPGRTDAFRASVGMAIPYIQALGNRRVHLMAGILPHDLDRAEAERTYVANVRFAAAALAPHGVTICLEAINSTSMPNFFLHTQEQTAACLSLIDSPHVAMQFDCFHCQMEQGGVAQRLRSYLPRIGHIQIAGAPERHEPDTGELRYEYLFALMDELGYSGHVGCEYNPASTTEAGLGWFAKWRQRA